MATAVASWRKRTGTTTRRSRGLVVSFCGLSRLLLLQALLLLLLLLLLVIPSPPSTSSSGGALFWTAVEARSTTPYQQQDEEDAGVVHSQEERESSSSDSDSDSDENEFPARSRRRRRRLALPASWNVKAWLRRSLGRIRKSSKSSGSNNKFSVTVRDDFLSAEEAATLLRRYRPLLRESRHAVAAAAASDARRSPYRTSHTVRLPPLGDALVFAVQERAVRLAVAHSAAAAAAAGNNTTTTTSSSSSSSPWLGSVEDLQLACYGPDELYALHRDDNAAGAAQRAATVLVYLRVPPSGGGGATLFTNRPLEAERDPRTRQPLQSEAAAVSLFRDYCRRPRRRHTVVEAAVGRAVAWWNVVVRDNDDDGDSNDDDSNEYVFVRDSTHGACPVTASSGDEEGAEKCVIQQWISRSPVRNPLYNAAAILTAGAAASFRDEALLEQNSLRDASAPARTALSGRTADGTGRSSSSSSSNTLVVEQLHPSDGTVAQLIPDGPYEHLGGLRLTGGKGLSTTTPLALPERWTVSFWVRHLLQSGTTLVSLVYENENLVTVTALASGSNGERVDTLQLQALSPSSLSIVDADLHPPAIHFSSNADEWMWFSFSIDAASSTMRLALFDGKGKALGHTERGFRAYHNCLAEPSHKNSSSIVLLAPPPPPRVEKNDEERATPAFAVAMDDGKEEASKGGGTSTAFVPRKLEEEGQAEEPRHFPHADVSFILFHDRILDNDEIRDLQRQARRYDINL